MSKLLMGLWYSLLTVIAIAIILTIIALFIVNPDYQWLYFIWLSLLFIYDIIIIIYVYELNQYWKD